jgi:hypothetical protein
VAKGSKGCRAIERGRGTERENRMQKIKMPYCFFTFCKTIILRKVVYISEVYYNTPVQDSA